MNSKLRGLVQFTKKEILGKNSPSSICIGTDNENAVKGVYIQIFRIGLISSAVWSFVIYFSSYYITELFFYDMKYLSSVQLVSIDIFLQCLIAYLIALLIASQEFRRVAFTMMFNAIIKFSAATALVLLGLELDGIIFGLIIGDAISVCILIFFLLPKIRGGTTHKIKPLFNYSLPIYGYNLTDILSREFDIYLLLILSSLAVVGIYSPAVMIGTILYFILGSMDQTLLFFRQE